MNKAQHVAALFSSQAEMARVLGRHPAIVTRMVKAGRVPGVHNKVLEKWAKDHGCLGSMMTYLEELCPCCGKELTQGQWWVRVGWLKGGNENES